MNRYVVRASGIYFVRFFGVGQIDTALDCMYDYADELERLGFAGITIELYDLTDDEYPLDSIVL